MCPSISQDHVFGCGTKQLSGAVRLSLKQADKSRWSRLAHLSLLLSHRLSPLYLGSGDPVAPVRTAKAERRHQERLRMQSPELLSSQEKELSPAERRALEAEKRAMWRAAR